MTDIQLQQEFDALRAQSVEQAGELYDIPRRVKLLMETYDDSRGNHAFFQIAAHGALWATGYFEVGGSVGQFMARRYFYNATERTFRLGLLNQFAERFRAINRLVCIDTVTNYRFTKQFGREPGAERLVAPPLLEALNTVHAARERGLQLDEPAKRKVFEQSFLCEQEITVAPGVAEAVAGFDCKILRTICLRPLVRFSFFPRCNYMIFRDFSNKAERIEKGLRAYDRAAAAGWNRVRESMRDYRLPAAFGT
ncbi:MAG: hypothetical protein NT069_25520 [Planctomycetota bacterium]|nr:hypothetical protein [Planctomycetota bacterium]